MDKFLLEDDDSALLIQAGAADLFKRLSQIDPEKIGMPEHCLHYYKASHSKRLFFSIQTSAHLLYRSINLTGKNISEITIMDYGAGVGTLYLLAKIIGCGKVVYNDHLDDWKNSAELIANAVSIKIDQYVVGDISECLDVLDRTNTQCDIITSRNVIEHIYQLKNFYTAVCKRQPKAIIFSSTTANSSNPAAVIKHRMWHNKWEKVYRGKRLVLIKRSTPELNMQQAEKLALATKGLAMTELNDAIGAFINANALPDPSVHKTNTCDPDTGVWAEHLLTKDEYREVINTGNYNVSFQPGFWDTHYNNRLMNALGIMLNKIIQNTGFGMNLAPFIYVIAIPKYLKSKK